MVGLCYAQSVKFSHDLHGWTLSLMLESQGYCCLQRFSFSEINFSWAVAIKGNLQKCLSKLHKCLSKAMIWC